MPGPGYPQAPPPPAPSAAPAPYAQPHPIGQAPYAVAQQARSAPSFAADRPGLGITALAMGIAALVLGTATGAVVGYNMFNGFQADDLPIGWYGSTWWLGSAVGVAAIAVGIVAAVHRRGRTQGWFGVGAAVLGGTIPVAVYFIGVFRLIGELGTEIWGITH